MRRFNTVNHQSTKIGQGPLGIKAKKARRRKKGPVGVRQQQQPVGINEKACGRKLKAHKKGTGHLN